MILLSALQCWKDQDQEAAIPVPETVVVPNMSTTTETPNTDTDIPRLYRVYADGRRELIYPAPKK